MSLWICSNLQKVQHGTWATSRRVWEMPYPCYSLPAATDVPCGVGCWWCKRQGTGRGRAYTGQLSTLLWILLWAKTSLKTKFLSKDIPGSQQRGWWRHPSSRAALLHEVSLMLQQAAPSSKATLRHPREDQWSEEEWRVRTRVSSPPCSSCKRRN
jgi:hypothetical protein